MKKVVSVVLFFCLAASLFAQEKQPWVKSYNKDYQLNAYASIGYWGGFSASAGAEMIFSEFNFGGVIMDWGIALRGIIETWSYTGVTVIYYGAAPMFTLHLGLEHAPFEFYIGAGPGLYGHTGTIDYSAAGFNQYGVGFASIDGAIWHFADDWGLIVEYGYVGYTSIWGVGLEYQFSGLFQ